MAAVRCEWSRRCRNVRPQYENAPRERSLVKVAMMQPSFLPWQGFFGLIYACDRFVFGDDYQFSQGSFHQRNRLFRNAGEVTWMTVPMQKKHSQGLPLNEARIAEETPWRDKMWKQIRNTYRAARRFSPAWPPPWNSGCGRAPVAGGAEHRIHSPGLRTDGYRTGISSQLAACVGVAAVAAGCRFAALVRSPPVPLCPRLVRLHAPRRHIPRRRDRGVVSGVLSRTPPASRRTGTFVPYLSVLDALLNIGPEATRDLIAAGAQKWHTWDEMFASGDAHAAVEVEPFQEHT